MKQILKWLNAKSKKEGATLKEMLDYIKLEICEMGATSRTIRGYIRDLSNHGLIQTKKLKFVVSPKGKNWLERKNL